MSSAGGGGGGASGGHNTHRVSNNQYMILPNADITRPSYANVAAGNPYVSDRFNTLSAASTPIAIPGQQQQQQQSTPQVVRQPSRSSLVEMDIDSAGVPLGRLGDPGVESWRRSDNLWSAAGPSSSTIRGSDTRWGCTIHDSHPPFPMPSYLRRSSWMQTQRRRWNAHIADLQQRALSTGGKSGTTRSSTQPSTIAIQSPAAVKPSATPSAQPSILRQSEQQRKYASSLAANLLPFPTRWNEKDAQPGLEILAEGSEVRFNGTTKTTDDAASVRSNHALNKNCGMFYFEVTVLSRSRDAIIGIGLSSHKVALNRQVGWEAESWGFHGDDGLIFASSSNGKAFGPRFASNDVVGCGVNFQSGTVFFTKNGVHLGTAFTGVKLDGLYPSVGMKKPGEHLRVNFGRHPFAFDIDRLVARERASILATIDKADTSTLSPPHTEADLVQRVVGQYLAHEGFIETAAAFAQDVRNERDAILSQSSATEDDSVLSFLTSNGTDDRHTLHRQKIRRAILEGDIDRALKHIDTIYPHVLEMPRNKKINFRLHCRKFIEMMRRLTELQAATAAATASLPDSKGVNRRQSTNGHVDPIASQNIGNDEHSDTQMELDEQLKREAHPRKGRQQHPTKEEDYVVADEDEDVDVDDEDEEEEEDDDEEEELDESDVDMDASIDSDTIPTKTPHMKQNDLLAAALAYGQQLQSEFGNDASPEVRKQLGDIFAIMAYKDPATSVVGGLLDPRGRAPIAEEVNSAILVSLGQPPASALEKVCIHTYWLLREATLAKAGPWTFVNTRKDFLQPSEEGPEDAYV